MAQQKENITLADLNDTVNRYFLLSEEIRRLEMSKAIARDTLLEAFKATGMRVFQTDSGLKAEVSTRIRKYIGVTEAKALLSPDLFRKLVREGASVILVVRPVKEGEDKQDGDGGV